MRLAVTGAPGTGKTTVSEALAILLGLPRTDAGSARGIALEGGVSECVNATLRAFEKRVHEESRLERFVSDGSLLQEWALERAQIDCTPPTHRPIIWAKGVPERAFTKGYVRALEGIAIRRARKAYDGFIHLSLDRSVDADPGASSDDRRVAADRLLIHAIHQVGKPYAVVGGPIEGVVRQVVGFYGFGPRAPIEDAVAKARSRAV